MTRLDQNLKSRGFELKDGAVIAGDGLGFRNLLEAGKQWLELHVEVVNRLNVFPVPDGDTGTNMLLTLRAAIDQVQQGSARQVGVVAQAMALGALRGARGNSGVILSQLLQGLARGLAGKVTFSTGELRQALHLGVDQAYQSMMTPVEGTILTVARAAAGAAGVNRADLMVMFKEMVAAARAAQANTPELLPVLKEAGVTDSGGQGLVYILEGGLRLMTGQPLEAGLVSEVRPRATLMSATAYEPYGYDVQFLIQGQNLDVAEIQSQINNLGWSTLVVGDGGLVKVHLHTSNPSEPLDYGASQGIISDVVIENLTTQVREFEQLHSTTGPDEAPAWAAWSSVAEKPGGGVSQVGIVAVAPGAGLGRIFQSLGAGIIVAGGPTMNPSTQELLNAVDQIKADDVLILSNDGNVIPAAHQAEKLSPKRVKVIPTKTAPQGIAALLAFNYQADLAVNLQRMNEAARQVQTIAVTRSVRPSSVNGFKIKAGDVIGLLDEELLSSSLTFDETVLDILAKIDVAAAEICTVYFGRERSPEQAQNIADQIRARWTNLDVEVYEGGQPHYDYIISLE